MILCSILILNLPITSLNNLQHLLNVQSNHPTNPIKSSQVNIFNLKTHLTFRTTYHILFLMCKKNL